MKVRQLQHWKYELSLCGEWTDQTAGGSIQYEKEWTKNPMFVLTLPNHEKPIEVFVHLEQAQEAADITPFSVDSLHPSYFPHTSTHSLSYFSSLLFSFPLSQHFLWFQVYPYQNYIGYYVYDMTLKELLFQTKSFLNSQSVYSVFTLDTSSASKFIIVPCTHEPGQLARFSLHISSEVEFKVAPVKKTFQ